MKLILRPNAKEKCWQLNSEVSCMLFYFTAGKRHLGFEVLVGLWVCGAVTAETVGL